jgi:glycosidase
MPIRALLLSWTLLAAPAALRADWPPAVPLVEPPPVVEAQDLSPSITAERITPDRFRVRFELLGLRSGSNAALVGSFNGWDAAATPLRLQGSSGSATLELSEGRYSYKFVVDGRWFEDPRNPAIEPDGYGGANSLLALGAYGVATSTPAKRLDGTIDAQGLAHDPTQSAYVQRTASGSVTLRLRARANDIERAWLATPDGARLPLARLLVAPPFEWWEAHLPTGLSVDSYTFLVEDGAGPRRLPDVFAPSAWPAPARSTPAWAKQAIWYQVMLDRFDNGDPANDPPDALPWKSAWYKPSPKERRSGESFYRFYVFRRLYGGDLAGLERRLDYLRDLGVNALYLNPVFEADTHHKYNATNYLHIDQHFGFRGDYAAAEASEDLLDPSTWTWTDSDRRFLEFLKVAKSKGFRVILDGVWNHVGILHPAFRDVQRHGSASPFAGWFDVTSWDPFVYRGWGGYGELPAFKKTERGLASESLVQHIHAVTRRWMDPDGDGDPSDGVDGWRLDVPNEIPLPFWVDWCAHVRSINPEAYISGEIWDFAPDWLDGRSFDALMNYPFARQVFGWLAPHRQRFKPSEVDADLAELRLAYGPEHSAVLMNLLDSHDTDRIVSMLANPNRGYDQENREQDGAPYAAGKPGPESYQRARLAVLLQMTYPGAPMVYYGDEVGMWGSDDPNNRRPMLWKDLGRYADPGNVVMEEHLAYYKTLIRLRREHSALSTGSFRTLLTDDARDLWAFLREDEHEQVLVLLNASGRDQLLTLDLAALALPGAEPFELLFGLRQLRPWPTLSVPALSGLILWRSRHSAGS